MSSNSYEVYIDRIIELAAAIVIKSEHTAQAVNQRLLETKEFAADPYDLPSWKYYLNLAGEYHSTDEIMTVVSSDNLETIVFNKQNLLRHKNTKRDYLYGTRQFGELLDRYPNQMDVILGILYPVDIDTAIAAKDHQILGWPDYLVESNEYTLINELQWFTDNFFAGHTNPQYSISHDMYMSVEIARHRLLLIQAIIVARKKRCKTIEAHSFHVAQYLASHSDLGNYHPFMTLSQAHKLYRDVKYYQRHSGTNQNLEDLTEDLLTARALPLADFNMVHDTTEQIEEITPVALFRKADMTIVPSVGTADIIDLDQMLDKESVESPGNPVFISDNQVDIEETLVYSPSATVLTKVLESATIDFSGSKIYKFHDILVSHWLYYACTGKYQAAVSATNPKTNERIVLSAKDAYILATYCLYRSRDIDPVEIPKLAAVKALRDPLPTRSDLESICDMSYIDSFSQDELWRFVSSADPMVSIDAFYERCQNLFVLANYQRDVVAFQDHLHGRAEVYKYMLRFWCDAVFEVVPEGTTYQEFLNSKNISLDLSRSEYELLFAELVSKGTGEDLSTTPSLRNIQKAMLGALKSLSSYSVQFVGKMSDEQSYVMDFPMIRGGDQNVDGAGNIRIRLPYLTGFSQKVNGQMHQFVEVDSFGMVLDESVSIKNKWWLDLSIGPHRPSRGEVYHGKARMPRPEWTLSNPPDVSGTRLQSVLGQDIYMSLTPEQKRQFAIDVLDL